MTTGDFPSAGDPAVGARLLDFGNTLGVSLRRDRAKDRTETMRALLAAMGHQRRGERCACGSTWAPGEVPGEKYLGRPGVPAEGACGAGWDTAARMWADGWRHGPPADRITLTLSAGRVDALIAALRGWAKHRREQWLPADNELRRLRGEPPHEDTTGEQPDLFGEVAS